MREYEHTGDQAERRDTHCEIKYPEFAIGTHTGTSIRFIDWRHGYAVPEGSQEKRGAQASPR